MRSGKSLLLLVLVAAGLGAYIYFVEMKRDPVADADAPVREKVFSVATGSIDEVEITNAAAEVTKVTRKDTTWTLVAPEATEADTFEVSSLVSSLESLERMKVIEENPASAAPFGLEPARIRVSFKAGDKTQTLLIGSKTPTGSDLYAKVDGAPSVFLISASLEDTFNRKAFDLRDKTALKFTRDDVNALTVVNGAARVELAKTAGDWRLAGASPARADGSTVDAVIGQLTQAKMTSLATNDGTATLKQYGLDKPQLVVTVGTGSSSAALAFGKNEDDTHVYARDLSRPLVFSVDKSLFDELVRKADDYRVKDVFAFRSFSALGLDVVSGGQTYSFGKSKGEGENAQEKWSMTAPAVKDVEAAKWDDFMMTMSNLRAESFAAKALTGGDAVTITAKFGDAAAPRTETVTLRKVGTVVHAIVAGEPGAAVVSTADFDRAMGLFKELTAK